MQCIILAAGNGTRLRPLTETVPKPLINVAGKTLLDHTIDSLPDDVREIVVVIGYLGNKIQEHLGTEYKGRKVIYVTQTEQKGTGHAVMITREYVRGKFLVMSADDVHGKDALQRLVSRPAGILVAESETPERFGVIVPGQNELLERIVEKPKVFISNLVSTGVMLLPENIFDYPCAVSETGEYYLPDMLTNYAKVNPVHIEKQDLWIPVNSLEELDRANRLLTK